MKITDMLTLISLMLIMNINLAHAETYNYITKQDFIDGFGNKYVADLVFDDNMPSRNTDNSTQKQINSNLSKDDLAALMELINNLVIANGCDYIDVINAPMKEKDLVRLGVIYVYAFEGEKVKQIENGPPVQIYEDSEPYTNYSLVSIKSVKNALYRIFGYKLHLDEKTIGRIYDFNIYDGCFVIGPGDPGADAPLVPISANRDRFGYVRVICKYDYSEENGDNKRYYVVARDHIVDERKSWKILLFKKIK